MLAALIPEGSKTKKGDLTREPLSSTNQLEPGGDHERQDVNGTPNDGTEYLIISRLERNGSRRDDLGASWA